MPGLFNEIMAGRYNRGLTKLFSIKGAHPPAPQLASEIMPVLPLFAGNELRNLEAWQRFSASINLVGVAASVSDVRIRVPKATLLVTVIEQISIDFTQADEWKVRVDVNNASDLATPLPAGQLTGLDNRGQFAPNSVVTTTSAAASVTANWDRASGIANTTVWMIQHQDDEITLLPDMQLTLESSTVNSTGRCSLRWRERVMEESEGRPLGGVGA